MNDTSSTPLSQPVISIEDLVRRFGGITAVDHLRLSVAPGIVCAVTMSSANR